MASNCNDEINAYKSIQTRRWLDDVRASAQRLTVAAVALSEERDRATRLKAIVYDGQPGSVSVDKMASAIAKIDECADYLLQTSEEYERCYMDAMSRLKRLDNPSHQAVLTLRYCAAMPWRDICARLGYTRDGAMKLHAAAVVAAYDVMPLNYRDPVHAAI